MLRKHRDVIIALCLAVIVSICTWTWLSPLRPDIPVDDTNLQTNYKPGGAACQSDTPQADRRKADPVDCAEKAEQHRIQQASLEQQARESNAAEAQARLSYDVALMILFGTIGGVFTFFAAGAAALYARDAARAARGNLSHAISSSEAELRPWLQIKIVPIEFRLTDEGAAARYSVRVKNIGKVPATGVYTSGQIFNSGSATADIPEYFAAEFVPAKIWPRRAILPQGEIELQGTCVPRERDHLIVDQAGVAKVHAVLAIRVVYGWGEARKGRTCQSYVMYPLGSADGEAAYMPINPVGDTRRGFQVRQIGFEHIS